MKSEGGTNRIVAFNKSTYNKRIFISADGYKVKLNFSPEPGESAINDVKRMMLSNTIKK